ncbi:MULTISPECIES: hypothetical protein [Brucella]|uniref:hypothetical protein n=1 Tax=Brucella/Ochrobactrum group TaxID=2826938 RepID=UPI0009A1C340|nr:MULTISPECIES: hypothetical protein [Brucella]MQP38768.1 hypothetical protein [Ochrobactrum sp. MYb237]QWK78632.1 hypothetical protein KMS41_05205 [Ochrobactrum sp. BTU1]PQZ43387.1 hypothetical protein CQ059_05505 [Brucella pseudogrignonensis]PRA43134.1 hypothetical protein CQ063_01990 [Brucella pseudogrignonensis]PRA72396.1 hypothetical protein CQ055_03590 [Brucella pseudogrignonensis]
MTVQSVNAGGNLAEIIGAIAKEASEAVGALLKKGQGADVSRQVEGIVNGAKRLDGWGYVYEIPASPYATPNVPEGYQTVLGYMFDQNPGIFTFVKNPKNAWKVEEAWLQAEAARRGLKLPRVRSPKYLSELGQSECWAYPLELLREKLF